MYVKETETNGKTTTTSVYRITNYIKEFGFKKYLIAVLEGRTY